VQQRAFARTAGAHDGRERTGPDLKIDTVECDHAVIVPAIHFLQRLDIENRPGSGFGRSLGRRLRC
jgi:hypothetical protein